MNQDQFKYALKCGRGSAIRYVQQYGADAVRDILLAACIENQAYDGQCEGNRADWLFSMIRGCKSEAWFAESLVKQLNDPDEYCDLEQVCELLAKLALAGHENAAHTLRQFVWGQVIECEMDDWYGFHAIISLDGEPALIRVIRILGSILKTDERAYVDSLDSLTHDTGISDTALALIESHADSDEYIALYINREKREAEKEAKRESETPIERDARIKQFGQKYLVDLPVELVIQMAKEKQSGCNGKFRQFGRFAGDAERQAILRVIDQESDLDVVNRLARVFMVGEPAWIPAQIWTLLASEDENTHYIASKFLSNSKDVAVGDYVRQYLHDQSIAHNPSFLRLLKKHLIEADVVLIYSVLNTQWSDDDLHEAGRALLEVCEENKHIPTGKVCEWMYLNNPCSLCREGAIDLLIEHDYVSADVINEGVWDVNGDTVQKLKQYSKAT
ncbi:hypothetical protein KSF73_10540 [Burkholderiaceae bacterium DAT-1]|nr:hypothetical protein [Burkholderiaceae bacterium DAT-1]